MASSDVVNKPPSRRTPAAGRAGRAMAVLGGVRRTTLLLLLAAVVLSLGLVAGNGSGEDRAASFSEIAQTDARAAAAELSRQARALAGPSGAAGTATGGTAPAAGLPARLPAGLTAELGRQADVLADQAVLLVRPGSLRSGTLPFSAEADAAPVTAEAYVRALSASARASLTAAVRAEAGTARLLASTGAAQQVLADRAATAAGLDLPGRWRPVRAAAGNPECAPAGDASGAGAATSSAGGVTPSSSGTTDGSGTGTPGPAAPDAEAALRAAVDVEFGAAYAYEVALARTASPAASAVFDELRDGHLAAGAEAVGLLPQVCLPALTPAPAYALPAAFGADPAEALADLEAALPAVYADLAALGDGTVRTWAIERLVELSLELYTDQGAVPAAPGLDAQPEGLPWAGGTA